MHFKSLHFHFISFTDASVVWRHGIFLTTSSASPIPTATVSGRRHPRS